MDTLTIGKFEIPLYGIFFYLGIVIAVLVAWRLCKRASIEGFDLVASAIYVFIGAIAGAKLLFLAVSWKTILELQLPLEAILKGGFVFYGGFLGGMAGLAIYTRQYRLPTARFFDMYAVVVPLGHAFGRIGCFFAGCCYGIPYDGIFCYTYHTSAGNVPLGVPLLPVQLIEAALLMVLFVVLLILYLRQNSRVRTSFVYLAAYPVIRFTLEFFRGDAERGSFAGLSLSQWISLGILLFALLALLRTRTKKQKEN